MEQLDKDVLALFKNYTGIKHENIPTGMLPYDILAGGDIQLGSCIAIGGAEGAGKSTAYLQMCKYVIEHQGRNVCYVDAEKSGAFMKQLESFDLKQHTQFADNFNGMVQLPKLWWVNNINTYSEFQNLCKQLIALKKAGKINYEYIILDSISALTQTKMINGDCEAAAVAYDALPISKLIKSIRGILYNAGITLCFVAQASSNIGAGMYDPEWSMKLTRAIRHCCDILYCIEKRDYKSYKIYEEGQSIQGSDKEALEVGYLAYIWSIKNRAVRSQKLKVPYIYGKGVDNVRFLMNILDTQGLVTDRASKGVRNYKLCLTGDPLDTKTLAGWDAYKNYVVTHYDDIVKYLFESGRLNLSNKNYMITADTDDNELSEEEAIQLDLAENHDEISDYANDQSQNTTEIEVEAIPTNINEPKIEILSTAPADDKEENVDMSEVQNLDALAEVLKD